MTQKDIILELLRWNGAAGITALDALEIGCFRLAARIADLRADGYEITSTMELTRTAKRIARYRIVEQAEQLTLVVA
jgi:hypothetical protein